MMYLAGYLGKTLAELDSMTYKELLMWERLYLEEPFGYVRTDLQFALLSLTVARSMGGNKRLTLDDFMIQKRRSKTPEEIAAKTIALFERLCPQETGIIA